MNRKRPGNTCMGSSVLGAILDRCTAIGTPVVLLVFCVGAAVWGQGGKIQPAPADPDPNLKLLQVRRICVQSFGADALGLQVQEIIIARLYAAKRFSLTEDCDRADFVLKGSITERDTGSQRSESEGVVGMHTSNSSSERKQQAVVTLRVVDKEGEILWATSQESPEGKSKGAIGLVGEQVVRKLLRDIDKAERQQSKAKP